MEIKLIFFISNSIYEGWGATQIHQAQMEDTTKKRMRNTDVCGVECLLLNTAHCE